MKFRERELRVRVREKGLVWGGVLKEGRRLGEAGSCGGRLECEKGFKRRECGAWFSIVEVIVLFFFLLDLVLGLFWGLVGRVTLEGSVMTRGSVVH